MLTYQTWLCATIYKVQGYCNQGRQTGGVGGVATPPEFWMGGGVNTCQPPPPPLILRRFFLGGGGLAPLKLI